MALRESEREREQFAHSSSEHRKKNPKKKAHTCVEYFAI